jgi:hypothetical protein
MYLLRLRKDHSQTPLLLEIRDIPPKGLDVAVKLLGKLLEQYDQPGLVILHNPVVDDLHSQGGLSTPRSAFQHDRIMVLKAAVKDPVSPRSPCINFGMEAPALLV